ncbi:MAG: histidine phosphatase family protein [Acidimicrobiales bacterium]|nr:histidine phosphatase family protein [Acidimicrobiales bacterium]MCB1259344.1 histidine phosphatase family protein [Acidimicrobiales bacterium]
MELIFVRHGQPGWDRDGRAVADPDLTDLGCAQADHVARLLADTRIDELLVSPLRRAQQTAAPLVEATGLTPTTLDWLAEISAPDWDGTPTEEVERIFRENRDRSVDELWDGLPGGESFRDFHVRITTGLEGLLRDRGAATARATPPQWHLPTDERRVVIVAHAGTNATAIGHLLGVAPVPWEWERFALRHASISTLVPLPICGAHAYRLEGLSDVGHLPATLHTY